MTTKSKKEKKVKEFRHWTLDQFKKRYARVNQTGDPQSLRVYDRIITLCKDSIRHVGQYVLVVERKVDHPGEMGCSGWSRHPETSETVSLGVLASTNTRIHEFTLELEFDTGGKYATGRPHGQKVLVDRNLDSGFLYKSFRQVTVDHGLGSGSALEIIIGDEAVEKWFADEGHSHRYDFDSLYKVLGRPNKAMQKEQAEREEAERKRLLGDIEESMRRLRESVRRAEELGLGKESIVQEVVALLASRGK